MQFMSEMTVVNLGYYVLKTALKEFLISLCLIYVSLQNISTVALLPLAGYAPDLKYLKTAICHM